MRGGNLGGKPEFNKCKRVKCNVRGLWKRTYEGRKEWCFRTCGDIESNVRKRIKWVLVFLWVIGREVTELIVKLVLKGF